MVTCWDRLFKPRCLQRFFCLLFFLALWGFSSTCEALSPGQRDSFGFNVRRLAAKNIEYVWGGVDPDIFIWDTKKKRWAKGLDCSGYVKKAATDSGIMGLQRTTSYNMAMGKYGWESKIIPFKDAEETDLLYWTFEPDRPFGHVGVAMIGEKSGLLEAAHASYSRGVIITPLLGSLMRDLVRVRRLTIGD